MSRKSTINFVVDLISLLAIFALVATGLIIRFVLPPGTGGRHGEGGLMLWGLGRHAWGDLHFWTSVVLAALLVLHVALHWTWVCAMTRRLVRGTQAEPLDARTRHAYGVGFLSAVVIVFGGFTWYAKQAVKPMDGTPTPAVGPAHTAEDTFEGDSRARRQAHDVIRGSMSLEEVERETGVPVNTLISGLSLPADTAPQDKLGRLGRQYGFDMDDVRAIVAKAQSVPTD